MPNVDQADRKLGIADLAMKEAKQGVPASNADKLSATEQAIRNYVVEDVLTRNREQAQTTLARQHEERSKLQVHAPVAKIRNSVSDTDAAIEAYDGGVSKELVALKKTRKLKRLRIRLMFAITKKNQHEIDDMKALASECGLPFIMYSASINARFYLKDPDVLKGFVSEWAQDDYFHETGNENYATKGNISRFYETVHRNPGLDIKDLDSAGLTTRHFCQDPWRTLVVNWNGTVSLCCADYHKYEMGDVSKDSLVEIWNNEAYRNLPRHLAGDASVSLPADHPCPSCVLY